MKPDLPLKTVRPGARLDHALRRFRQVWCDLQDYVAILLWGSVTSGLLGNRQSTSPTSRRLLCEDPDVAPGAIPNDGSFADVMLPTPRETAHLVSHSRLDVVVHEECGVIRAGLVDISISG